MMTIHPAYSLFIDNELGSLKEGKLVDMLIISDNPVEIETDKLKDIQELMTMIGSKVEYCAPGSEALCP